MPRVKTIYSLLFVAILCVLPLDGQDYNHEYNPAFQVHAYELDPQEEAQFSSTDGALSCFWQVWDARSSLDRERLSGNQHYTWGNMPDGSADVGMELRMAYGEAGVYLFFQVTDDHWEYFGDHMFIYKWDAVELFTESHGAGELYSNPSEFFPCLSHSSIPHQLTHSYAHMQVPFGNDTEKGGYITYNHWHLAEYHSSSCFKGSESDQGVIKYTRNSLDYARNAMGIILEIIDGQHDTKTMEWLVPWAVWGGFSEKPPRQYDGDTLGICFGYNDWDPGQHRSTALRWRKADPYSSGHTSYDAWGDVLFSQTLQSACGTENTPPTITSQPVIHALAGHAYRYQVDVQDPDEGSTVTLSFLQNPDGMTIDGRSLVWVPTDADTGIHIVRFRVTDNLGASASQSFGLEVSRNDPPVFYSSPPLGAIPDHEYAYAVTATAPEESDEVTLALLEKPSGMRLDGNVIRWTPALADTGQTPVIVVAHDTYGASTLHEFTIVVRKNGLPPVIDTTIGLSNAYAEISYKDTLFASDPEEAPLFWEIISDVNGLTIDSISGILSWTPGRTDVGSTTFRVTATDNILSDTAVFTIDVLPSDDRPVITTAIPDTFYRDSSYTITLSAVDRNLDPLIWKLLDGPGGMTIEQGQLLWKPDFDNGSPDSLLLAVWDGGLGDTLLHRFIVPGATPIAQVAAAQEITIPYLRPHQGTKGVTFSIGIPSTATPVQFELFGVLGKRLHHSRITGAGKVTLSLPHLRLSSGIYFAKLRTSTGQSIVSRFSVR